MFVANVRSVMTRVVSCAVLISLVGFQSSTYASVVTYTGTGAASGLSATADFQLVTATKLVIILTNTSVSPPNGADMVLSSINFDLGAGVDIVGGSVILKSGSLVVVDSSGVWGSSGYTGDLNSEYGYSNEGVGNGDSGGSIYSGITQAEVQGIEDSAATSHSNGGSRVKKFSDGSSGLPGGLDFGLVAQNSSSFGNKEYIQDGVVLTLNLDTAISDLSFLDDGSYVEFGSDYAYVGGGDGSSGGSGGAVPEPASIAVWSALGCACFGFSAYRRRRKV